MGAAMHAESRYARFAINLKKGEQFFRSLLTKENALVLVDGDPVCAMFVGYVNAFWWGNDLESHDLLLYVVPERRGGTHAVKLIKAYVAWAEEKGASDIKIGVSTGIEYERTVRLFERMGFRPFSNSCELEPRTVH